MSAWAFIPIVLACIAFPFLVGLLFVRGLKETQARQYYPSMRRFKQWRMGLMWVVMLGGIPGLHGAFLNTPGPLGRYMALGILVQALAITALALVEIAARRELKRLRSNTTVRGPDGANAV